MATVNGSLIFLRNDTLKLVGQLDGNIGGATDQLDATTKDSAEAAKEFINGETTWDGSVTALYDAAGDVTLDDVITQLKAGTAWTVKFGQVTTGSKYLAGTGYLKSWRWTGPKNALSNISVEFQGTAALALDTN